MPERVSGVVDLSVTLADGGVGSAGVPELPDLVASWIRAVQIGLFGSGRMTAGGRVEIRGRAVVVERLVCERVPSMAFRALSRMIERFSSVVTAVEALDICRGAVRLEPAPGRWMPDAPASVPFELETPEDLKHYLRVEIEFRSPLADVERDAIFDAFHAWDRLTEALGVEAQWRRQRHCETRLLSPAIVEHQVDAYFAGIEGLNMIVCMVLRLHLHLPVERLTLE